MILTGQQYDFETVELDDNRPEELKAAWRSPTYLVFHYQRGEMERLSVQYSVENLAGHADNIRWDVLQSIKNALGFADRWAVELYPSQDEEKEGIAFRHLWFVPRPSYAL